MHVVLDNRKGEFADVELMLGRTDATVGDLVDALRDGDTSARGDGRRATGILLDGRFCHADLALDEMGRSWLPVRRHWRLNERHYGALQGLDKKQTTAEFGEAQVKLWRRSYDTPPPPLSRDSESHPAHDERYRELAPGVVPDTECLADVVLRMVPYWEDAIAPDLRSFSGVLVVAHGNSIRALVKYLKDIPDDEIVGLEVPTGVPWWFRFDDDLELLDDRQLGDPDAIAAATEAVARQAG